MNNNLRLNGDYFAKMDPNGLIDFQYLNSIKPYEGDYKEFIDDLKIDDEIAALEKEMNAINLSSIPFKASDFIVIFLAGLAGGACDIILGKPANGYNGILEKAHEPKINNDFAFGLGKYLKQFDLTNNPIDKQIPGAPVGDHRLYSYGHDLFRFFKGVYLMLNGSGEIGIHGTGGVISLESPNEKWLESLKKLNIEPGEGDPKTFLKLAIILALHLYKDYCSARSLPIPGSTFLANLNDNTMPEFIDKLTNEMEYNLRTVTGQVLSIVAIEVIIGIYSFISKNIGEGKTYSKEQHKEKKQKMLLMSHTIAMLFNTGKVAITKNPAFINFPQIIRIVKLAWSCSKNEMNKRNLAVEKANLSILKNQMEELQTLVLLDEAIYYTNHIDRLYKNKKDEFNQLNMNRNKNLKKQTETLNELLLQLKKLNK